MRIHKAVLAVLPLLAVPLLAQPQIGGGSCTSATLSGTYSLTLSGRDVSSAVTFAGVSLGVGTITFDGLNKVSIALTSNTAKTAALATTWSGSYTMQANCAGTLSITTGGTATFALESYNQGKAFLITGEDTLYAYSGSGGTIPATCSASQLSGTYSFNGNGFALTSGAVSGVTDFSGLMQFDGSSVVTTTWYISAGGTTKSVTTSGTYTATSACSGTVSMTDTSGNAYAMQLTITSATGSFTAGGTSPQMVFTATGRIL
jgi:hypothetical protein